MAHALGPNATLLKGELAQPAARLQRPTEQRRTRVSDRVAPEGDALQGLRGAYECAHVGDSKGPKVILLDEEMGASTPTLLVLDGGDSRGCDERLLTQRVPLQRGAEEDSGAARRVPANTCTLPLGGVPHALRARREAI